MVRVAPHQWVFPRAVEHEDPAGVVTIARARRTQDRLGHYPPTLMNGSIGRGQGNATFTYAATQPLSGHEDEDANLHAARLAIWQVGSSSGCGYMKYNDDGFRKPLR